MRAPVVAAILVVVAVVIGVASAVLVSSPGGNLVIGVKDAPSSGAVTHIYLAITDITLQGAGNSSATYKVNATSFDLLKLTNVTKMLGKDTVPAGNYTMVRFSVTSAIATISGGNGILTNETLTVPSGEIKVSVQFTIASGKTTTVVLDIAADMTAISSSGSLRPTVTGVETIPPS